MRPLNSLKSLSGSRFRYGRKNQPSARRRPRADASCAGRRWRGFFHATV